MAVTLTGPDTVTEGTSTSATGTELDTVTTLTLQTDDASFSIEQTKGTQTATTIPYTPDSGINNTVGYGPGSAVNGIPVEADILASGATAYQVQQKVVV